MNFDQLPLFYYYFVRMSPTRLVWDSDGLNENKARSCICTGRYARKFYGICDIKLNTLVGQE